MPAGGRHEPEAFRSNRSCDARDWRLFVRHQSARKRRADIEAVALPHVLRPAGLVVRQRDHGQANTFGHRNGDGRPRMGRCSARRSTGRGCDARGNGRRPIVRGVLPRMGRMAVERSPGHGCRCDDGVQARNAPGGHLRCGEQRAAVERCRSQCSPCQSGPVRPRGRAGYRENVPVVSIGRADRR